ncbi:MAG: N,N-dimethylformamidase beta subunit family domain-containing protein, partial [Verrucomicrobiota bacterium]
MKKAILLPGLLLTCLSNLGADEPRSLFIEGYSGLLSYAPGEELQLHTSTSARQFEIQIKRHGAKTETVFSKSGIRGAEHKIPENASSHGCKWPVGFKMTLPADWKSGYYEVSLRVEDRGGKFVHRNRRTAEGSCYFILRAAHPGSTSKILLQLSVNTYNAYNNWGGSGLYSFHGRAKLQGHRVSFNRPPRSLFNKWEEPFVAWAESNGYALEYASNMDLALRPEILQHYRL